MTTETHHERGEDVDVHHLSPQPTLSVRETVPLAALDEAHDRMLRALADVLTRRGVRPAGPPVVRYHTFGSTETDVELAVPVAEPLAGEGQVVTGELPGGPAATTWHLGAHDKKLGEAYARLEEGVKARGRQKEGAAWEVYTWIDLLTYRGTDVWPDPSTWRTQLVQPLAQD